MDIYDVLCTVSENGKGEGCIGSNNSCVGSANIMSERALSLNHTAHKIVVAVITSFLALVILIGNGLIIVSVTLVRKLRQPANYLIVSLALSDFLVALVVLPLTIVYDILGEWVLGSTLCDIHVSFDVICCTTSIMNLCMISIDRYMMITRPLTYPKRRTGKLMAFMIITAWVLSCLIILPALFGSTENVTDEPAWIDLGLESNFIKSFSKVSATKVQTHFSGTSHWTLCSRSSDMLQYGVELDRDYHITRLRLNKEARSAISIQIQLVSLLNGNVTVVKKHFFETTSPSSEEWTDISTRFISISLQNFGHDGNESATSLYVYGEPIHGKTCLISQEVWFTIYSTVGAFYIPLTVMLCMYWKIYVEASRFKSRHRARSKTIVDQPSSMLPFKMPEGRMSTTEKTYEIYLKDTVRQQFRRCSRDETVVTRMAGNSTKVARRTELLKYRRENIIESNALMASYDDGVFGSLVAKPRENQASVERSLGLKTGCHIGKNLYANVHSNALALCQVNGKTTISLASMNEFNRSSSSFIDISTSTTIDRFQEKLETCSRKQLKGNRSYVPNPFTFPPARSSILSSGECTSTATRMKKASRLAKPLRRMSISSSRERLRNAKAIRTLGIIVAAFTFCWLPFFTLTFIRPFVCEHPESTDCFPLWLVRFVLWLGYLNSALNPIIYVGFSPDLRETFRFLICCKCANVDRRLAQIELRQAIEGERKTSRQISLYTG